MGSDDRDVHPVGGLRTREVEKERRDRVVGVARKRRGHVEDPVRHRPVPYGPVMSRADGASDGVVAGNTVGAVVPRWFELAVLCAVAFVAGYGLSSLVFALIGAFHVVLVIAVSLNLGLLCALGVLRLPPRQVEARQLPRCDLGRRDHRGRRRGDDGDERVGAEPARALDPRSGHLPHHRQVAVRAEPAPDRRRRRAVRDVGRGEPGRRTRLLPVGLSRRPLTDR